MNAFKLILYFLLFLLFLHLAEAEKFDFESNLNDKKVIKISAGIKALHPNSFNSTPEFENFCMGTPPQCFPVILNLHERHTQILNNTVINCGITPVYNNQSSSTFKRDNTMYASVDTIFGSANYLNANDSIQLNMTNRDNLINFDEFNFRIINKINRCLKVVSNGVLGLGPNNELLKKLKSNAVIDKSIYSAELSEDRKSLDITIGDLSQNMKKFNSEDKITYCNIVSISLLSLEYWGCNADIFLRTKNKHISLLSQTVLFYEILEEQGEDVPVIYFASMKTKYQNFLMEGFFDNNPKCRIDSSDVIACDTDLDMKSLPNLIFVINDVTYVFKPENLFYFNSTVNKNVLKVKFVEKNFNHIKFSQHFLFSQNISMVLNSEKNQVGFYGFNTHKYRGEDDDGNDENDESGESTFIAVLLIIVGIVIVAGIGFGIFRYCFKNRNNGSSQYVRY